MNIKNTIDIKGKYINKKFRYDIDNKTYYGYADIVVGDKKITMSIEDRGYREDWEGEFIIGNNREFIANLCMFHKYDHISIIGISYLNGNLKEVPCIIKGEWHLNTNKSSNTWIFVDAFK